MNWAFTLTVRQHLDSQEARKRSNLEIERETDREDIEETGLKKEKEMGCRNILNEIIIFNGLGFASSLVEFRDQQIQDDRRHCKSQAQQCLPQFICVNFSTPVSIKFLKYTLYQRKPCLQPKINN